MERKGGCLLVPRYGPGGGGQAAPDPGVSWQMGKIMLKFRPIAPKPAAMAPAPAPTPVPAAASGRGKRKAACAGGGGKRGRKPKKAATVASVTAATQTVGEKEKSSSSRSSSSSAMTSVDSSSPPSPPPPALLSTLPLMPVSPSSEKTPLLAPAPPVAPRPTASSCCVTVEDVTSTWCDGEAACVGGDDAPAFVSDRWGRVTWANAAFTKAVVSSSDDSAGGGSVALAGALPAWGTCAGFTCRVHVRHAIARRGGGGGSVVAPCDVWRLDADGCYLWQLDLQAALTLGLP